MYAEEFLENLNNRTLSKETTVKASQERPLQGGRQALKTSNVYEGLGLQFEPKLSAYCHWMLIFMFPHVRLLCPGASCIDAC